MMSGGPRRHGKGFNPLLAMGLGFSFVLILGLGKASSALGAASIPIWLAAIAGAVYLLRGPLGEALLHAIANANTDTDAALPGTDPAVLQELDDLRSQVNELQERMDFSERMLAQERATRPLGSGKPV